MTVPSPVSASEPAAPYGADLQLHSSASDGSDAPSEVVRRAAAIGLRTIALTDHDTMAGLSEAREAAREDGIELIPGVELSALEGRRQIDILGYGMDPDDEVFGSELARIRGGRLGRAWDMVEQLNALGYEVSWERVQELAGSENVGRPHVARAMVEAGVVPTIADAFTPEFIADGGRCYVERVKISPAEAIARIGAAGGVAVAAHPGRTGLTDDDIARLARAGLGGLEVFYPQHDEAMTERFAALAALHGLLVTGGSDDHGDVNEGRRMGSIRLPDPHVDALRSAISALPRRTPRAMSR
ncbi:MAG TPA: PHP domain-containing protein [Gemmatimonadaceae bacterium]|nr:PHP domain-containing protein [Gemmatimonadaceae bacterium]